jgi:DNA-directed RNA polymerase subunit RPC12/RpoP
MIERRKEARCPECNGVVFKWIDREGKVMKACLICGKEIVAREDELPLFKKEAEKYN